MPGRQSTATAGPVRRSRAPRVPVLVALPVVLALPALLRQAPVDIASAFVGTRATRDPAGGRTAQHAWKRPNLNLSPAPSPAPTRGAAAPATGSRFQTLQEFKVQFDAAYAALEDLHSKMTTLRASMKNAPAGGGVRAPPAAPPPIRLSPSDPRNPAAPRAASPPAAVPQGGTVASEYMVSDGMIEEFYQKTISGSGGLPPPGIIMDLVIKHFLGTFDAKTKSFTRTSTYKGPPPMLPGKKDLPPAMELLKEQMKSPAFVTKGGPALDETEKVEDDGKGWVWLAADMTPGGLALSLYTAVPYGKRPLLVAKQGEVDAMFDKVDWDVVLGRFEVTMGGPQIKQR